MNISENIKKGGKNSKKILRVAIFFGILAMGGVICFFVVGEGRGFLKKNSAIAAQSFREAFNISPDTASEEIPLQKASTQSSSSADVSSGGETVDVVVASPTDESILPPPSKSVIDDLKTDNATDTVSETDPILEPSSSPVVAPSSTAQKSFSAETPVARCSFSGASPSAASRKIILNEIAWMGSPAQGGASAAAASNNEWMELKNETTGTISLDGWELIDSAKNITIVFGDGDAIAPSSLYLLERSDDDSVPGIAADKIYSGSLPNTGDMIGIFDASCGSVDILDATDGWPGGDNGTKQTLERDASDFGWHTSASSGGTPKAENSNSVAAVTAATSTRDSASSTPPQNYMVAVTISGDGTGKVTSDPAGITCGSYCESSYALGKKMKLHETPGTGVIFSGWMGPCSGTAPDCIFPVTGYVSATAIFHNAFLATIDDTSFDDQSSSSSSSDPSGGTGQSSSTPSSTLVLASDTTPTLGHLVIAAVQVAGALSTNDFVKIYNPENIAVDISGWKLRKKSSTGTDYSLKEMPTGTTVPAGGYFTWANSAGGFSESVNADVSSTETLSADNSVALIDANGVMSDAVAWGTGTNQYMEGAAYPTDPAANQILARIFQNGAPIDTDNNAADFTIQ